MLRKLASVSALVFAGSLALAGTALAAPYDPATVGATRGSTGESYDFEGTGYGDTQADRYVTATVLSSSGELTTYRFSLDEDGNFSGSIPADECSATVTIVGYPSGETQTATISGAECNDPGDNGVDTGNGGTGSGGTGSGGGSAGVGGTGGSTGGSGGGSSSGSSGGSSYNGSGYSADSYSAGSSQGAYSNGYANTGAYSAGSGLANTGANIAAPIAIGLGTLVLGLGLLFFGTRGIVRRKGSSRA